MIANDLKQAQEELKELKEKVVTSNRYELLDLENKFPGSLASAYLSKEGKKIDRNHSPQIGETWQVNFLGNRSAEWQIGLGDFDQFKKVDMVRVSNDQGKRLEGALGVKFGRVGFYTATGEYIPIFSGDKVEVIEPIELTKVDQKTKEKKSKEIATSRQRYLEKATKVAAFIEKDKTECINPNSEEVYQVFAEIARNPRFSRIPEKVIRAFIKRESGWQRYASPLTTTALGPGQFTDGTWYNEIAPVLRSKFGIVEPDRTEIRDSILGVAVYQDILANDPRLKNEGVGLSNKEEVYNLYMAYHEGPDGYLSWRDHKENKADLKYDWQKKKGHVEEAEKAAKDVVKFAGLST